MNLQEYQALFGHAERDNTGRFRVTLDLEAGERRFMALSAPDPGKTQSLWAMFQRGTFGKSSARRPSEFDHWGCPGPLRDTTAQAMSLQELYELKRLGVRIDDRSTVKATSQELGREMHKFGRMPYRDFLTILHATKNRIENRVGYGMPRLRAIAFYVQMALNHWPK